MFNKKDSNNLIRKNYEEDQQYDRKVARGQLKEFIEKLNELGIQYENDENTEELWIKIHFSSISQEQKTSLMKLVTSLKVNFTIRREETYIVCYDHPVRNSN